MATSGSVNWSLTSRQIISEALENLNVIGIGDTPGPEDAAKALSVLNQMLKTWGTAKRLWLKTEGSVTLVASTASYVLTAAREVLSVRRRTSGIDTPLTVMSRQEYYDYPSKSATGMPYQWYFDPQRATRTLYVVSVPTATEAASTTLPYTYIRAIEDADALDNDADLPQEWMETILYGLMARLLVPYSVHLTDPAKAAEVKERAQTLYGQLSAYDDEDTAVFMQPSF